MNKQLASGISWVAHPLLMPTYLFILLQAFVPATLEPMNGRIALYVLLLIFLTTFLIPVLSLLGLKGTRTISHLRLEDRKERILPFIFITVFYLITAYLFKVRLELNPMLQMMFISMGFIVFMVTLLTFFFKISIHAAGAGGLAGYFLALAYFFPDQRVYLPFAGILLVSGFIMSSRLKLNVHTPVEVYLGFCLGLCIAFSSLIIP